MVAGPSGGCEGTGFGSGLDTGEASLLPRWPAYPSTPRINGRDH
jgi:hypothetical protein